MQEGDDSVENLFDDPRDDGYLAAEEEALEEADIERRENLQEESAGALADLSLSSKMLQESGQQKQVTEESTNQSKFKPKFQNVFLSKMECWHRSFTVFLG